MIQNSPSRVIAFVNAAHFIDHYAMLIFAAAVIVMGPALGMAYSELLPFATPGFASAREFTGKANDATSSFLRDHLDGELPRRGRV